MTCFLLPSGENVEISERVLHDGLDAALVEGLAADFANGNQGAVEEACDDETDSSALMPTLSGRGLMTTGMMMMAQRLSNDGGTWEVCL